MPRVRYIGVAVTALLALAPFASASWGQVTDSTEDPSVAASIRRGDAYAHLMRALMAARRGENRNAAVEIRRAIDLEPDSADVRVQGATLLDRMGRRVEALEVANDALELDPEYPPTLRFLADRAAETALARGGDEEAGAEALAYYEKLLRLGEEDDEILGRLVALRLQSGDREGALEAAHALVERRPGDRRAAGSLAQLLLEDNQERDALAVLLRFLAKHPNDTIMLRLADDLTRRIDAWPLVAEILSQDGGFGDRQVGAQGLLGEALLYGNRPEEAMHALEAALASGMTDTTLKFSLGRAYHGLGRLADAAVLFRQLADETDGLAGAHARRILGETLIDQGDVDGALEVFRAAIEQLEDESGPTVVAVRDGLRLRITSLLIDRDPSQAAAVLADVQTKTEPEALELQTRVAIAQHDWSKARRAIGMLRDADEKGLAALLDGEVLALTGRWNKAQHAFEESIGVIGNPARIRVGEVCRDAGRPDLGEGYLRQWIADAPTDADAHYYLGFFLFREDRLEESDREMRRAFELDPTHGPALNFLGYSYAERKIHLDEALELIQRALSQDSWSGAYLDSLGWVYFQMGRYEDARDPLERAAREHPKDPTVLEHLGDLYERLGQVDLAVAAWTRALAGSPDDSEALRAKISRESAQPQASSAPAGDDTERKPESAPPPMRP